jgi:hypothetical protein
MHLSEVVRMSLAHIGAPVQHMQNSDSILFFFCGASATKTSHFGAWVTLQAYSFVRKKFDVSELF